MIEPNLISEETLKIWKESSKTQFLKGVTKKQLLELAQELSGYQFFKDRIVYANGKVEYFRKS